MLSEAGVSKVGVDGLEPPTSAVLRAVQGVSVTCGNGRKHALTRGNVLNASHRFASFPSVSRTRRARSAVPPHPQRRSIRCHLRTLGRPCSIRRPRQHLPKACPKTTRARTGLTETPALRKVRGKRTQVPMPQEPNTQPVMGGVVCWAASRWWWVFGRCWLRLRRVR